MKYFILGALILLPCFGLFAQADSKTYQWVSHLHGHGQEIGHRLLIQPSGNLIVLGAFSDSIIFLPDTVSLPSTEYLGYFLVKYDTCGRLVWHQIWTASVSTDLGGIHVVGMEQDQQGYLYVAFSQLDTLSIEDRRIGTASRNLVIRLDAEGKLLNHFDPISQSQGNAHPYVRDMSVSTTGKIALTGLIDTNPVLGPGYIEIGGERLDTDVDPLTGHHADQAWLGVYTSMGLPIWTRVTHAPKGADSRTIAFDRYERLYWAGSFEARTEQHSHAIHFGFGTDSLFIDRGPGGFLLAYDSLGQFRWVRLLEIKPTASDTIGDIYLWELEVDPNDAVYLVGKLLGAFWLDSLRIPQTQTFLAGQSPVWISIINVSSDGEALWSAGIRSKNGNLWPHDLGFDKESNLYIGGSFQQDIHLGNFSFQNSNSQFDGFISSLSPAGIFRWSTTIEGNSSYSTSVRGIASNPDGRLFLTGKIDLPAQIGRFPLLEPLGQEFPRFGGDFFLASYGSPVDSLACHCASQPPVEAAFNWTAFPHTQTVQFHNQSIGGSQANWSLGDGQQSAAWSPTHRYADSDTFQVCLDVWDACSQSSICHPVALAAPLEFACDPQLWNIGPNPSAEQLSIRFSGAICESYLLRVFDMRGRLIELREVEVGRSEAISFDTRTWPEGIYVLHIQGRYDVHSVRIQRLD